MALDFRYDMHFYHGRTSHTCHIASCFAISLNVVAMSSTSTSCDFTHLKTSGSCMCVLYGELVEICIVGNITGNTRLVVTQGYNKIGRVDFDETFVAISYDMPTWIATLFSSFGFVARFFRLVFFLYIKEEYK